MSDALEPTVTVRQLWTACGVLASIAGLFLTAIFPGLIIPAVLIQVDERTDRKIESHTAHPHPTSINQAQWVEVLKRLDRIEARQIPILNATKEH